MKNTESLLKRQKYSIRFKNQDMDFTLNWMLGVSQVLFGSHGEIFYATSTIKDGDPISWRESFCGQGNRAFKRAIQFDQTMHRRAAGEAYLNAAYSYRASLQYADPTEPCFNDLVSEMENAFQLGAERLEFPIRPIQVLYQHTILPGYYLEIDREPRPTVFMVGGGDTYREDLFYFAGYPGWQRGYNVLMVDLPGQGKTPASGQHFTVDMARPISAALDWLEKHAAVPPRQLAIYGVSGGGYFTAQAASVDRRINAWVASTPIFDIANVFRQEFGNALRAPGWLMNLVLQTAGIVNAGADLSLKKYAWQFGTTDFKEAVERIFKEAQPVEHQRITCPSLFLVGENEGEELKRQAKLLFEAFQVRDQTVSYREFTADEGADAHCQINNLRLAHLVIFDWLDQIFEWQPQLLAGATPF